MSKIGNLPIELEGGVTVTLGDEILVKGPKGELSFLLPSGITVKQTENKLIFARHDDTPDMRAKHGLVRALVANMVVGVSEGFVRDLEMVGVGFRAEMKNDKLVLNVGFSHPVELTPLAGTQITVEKNNLIKISGIDKQRVGEMAAQIRAVRKPEPYKGKGIRYKDEVVRLKPGKAGASESPS